MKFKIKTLSDEFRITGISYVNFFDIDENFTPEERKHPYYELVYVSKGSIKVKSSNFTGTLIKNNLVIHSPDEIKSLIPNTSNSTTVVIIGFTCEGLPSHLLSKIISLSDQNIKKLAEAVKEGRNVFAAPHNVPVYDMKKNKNIIYGSEQILRITLEHFFINIIREHCINSKQENFPTKFNVNEIISYLDDKYKEKITLDELAFIFGTNRTTLCKEFKKATKTTILDYVCSKKIEEAKRKIKESNATFTEISIELNFDSIHYFTKFFKKKTGLTPKEYKRSICKK